MVEYGMEVNFLLFVYLHSYTNIPCKDDDEAPPPPVDSRKSKQDRYDAMRRKKDEEREAQERLLVRVCLTYYSV
jgi:hypothetical protein